MAEVDVNKHLTVAIANVCYHECLVYDSELMTRKVNYSKCLHAVIMRIQYTVYISIYRMFRSSALIATYTVSSLTN